MASLSRVGDPLGPARPNRWPDLSPAPPDRLARGTRGATLPLAGDLPATFPPRLGLPAAQRRGQRTALGFRNPEGRFEAHAWVEWNGVPLNDAPDVRSRYAVPAEALTPEYPPPH